MRSERAEREDDAVTAERLGYRPGLAWLVMVLAACAPTSADNPPRLVVYGHSYAAGSGGVEPWPELVAADLGMPLVNEAVGGDLLAQTATRVDEIPGSGDVVVVQAGLNDARRHGADRERLALFASNLRSLVAGLSSDGARVFVAVDADLAEWDTYAPFDNGSDVALAQHREVAERSGAEVIDLSIGWDPTRMVGADRVHPNPAGARLLADVVAASIGG